MLVINKSVTLISMKLAYNLFRNNWTSSPEMFAKEVNIVDDRTSIECVSRLSASSTGLISVKVFVGCWRIEAAVA